MRPRFLLHIRLTAATALVMLAAGCAVGPDYQRPASVDVSSFKEAEGWVPALPADALERGPWWLLFGDPLLDQLQSRVEVSNQNVAVAVAAYAQARALVREQQAALFPTVTLNGGASRSKSSSSSTSATGFGGRIGNSYQLSIGGSWEPDVWGRLGRAVEGASAGAQASAADLASATLSARGLLAVNYFSLRQTDAQKALLATTSAGYQRTLEITQNRYTAGIAAKTDVLQAQTQLATAKAEDAGLARTRAQLEHAIAVLVGEAPGNFSIAPLAYAEWKPVVPEVPAGVPSTLLQRRPDIAAAERRVAAANEQIGIVKSAYFPSLSLNASYGVGASAVASLFNASSSAWSLGLSAAQVLFNAGATGARVEGAQASHEQAVARYRQTVLAAFADVEDQLAATRVLLAQQDLRREASQAADQVEQQVLNRYRSGQVSFTDVITAQATALTARRALVQAAADRQTTAVALIQSLGGGWHAGDPATAPK
ncbi:efflux transporter outer membrane subunit [Polaromonas sp.]|jgi:NodT family efflux transporter outer membrane factor (OMF) lipoprotein|uniref:efflux transporter outer membrane subunit n=1 Tax=Polaromonas sp. TaxID=1869339 RepID=UPI002BD0F5AF|nr:efflux transporter outer membrane subunit [Polaromonas sp.]HQS31232.1 efflux transporter outer membrane subunit [Polaromonas sp.]HQS89821.1 efflux transporter outer membrane subunit [Polaromonas sp.]